MRYFRDLNLSALDDHPFVTKAMVKKAWDEGDILRVLSILSNDIGFVVDNSRILKAIGKYEEVLLPAYISIRTNYANWSMSVLHFLFMIADIEKLRKTGDPIPDQETFTLYRGVCGIGKKRRVNSFSWTESANTAAWFARRFCLHDPAVFKVTVPNESIMACCHGRNEREYLLRLPLPVKPKRLKEIPEAFLPIDKEKMIF